MRDLLLVRAAKAEADRSGDVLQDRVDAGGNVVVAGIDGLQRATNRLFWFDRSRDMTSNIQAEGRLDRRGQAERVIVEYAIARGSMDQDIMSDHLQRRLELNKSLRKTRRVA